MHARRALALLALLAASVLCVGLLELRIRATGDGFYRFLVWNLFLAWVPLVFAVAAYARARRGLDPLVAALLVAWLLVFPNAPYLLTDIIHLEEGPAPLWYDALMLSAFAWTGLLLGFAPSTLSSWSCAARSVRRWRGSASWALSRSAASASTSAASSG